MNYLKKYPFFLYFGVFLLFFLFHYPSRTFTSSSSDITFIHYTIGFVYGLFFILNQRYFLGSIISLAIAKLILAIYAYKLSLFDALFFTFITLVQPYLAFKLSRVFLVYRKKIDLLSFESFIIVFFSFLLVSIFCSFLGLYYVNMIHTSLQRSFYLIPYIMFWISRDFLGVLSVTPLVFFAYKFLKENNSSSKIFYKIRKYNIQIILCILFIIISSFLLLNLWNTMPIYSLALNSVLGLLVVFLTKIPGTVFYSFIIGHFFIASIPKSFEFYSTIGQNITVHSLLLYPVFSLFISYILASLFQEKSMWEKKYHHDHQKLKRNARFLPIGTAEFSFPDDSISANFEWSSITGLKEKTSLTLFFNQVDTGDRFRVQQYFTLIEKEGRFIETEFKYNHSNGKQKWLLLTAGKDFSKNSEVSFYMFLLDLSQTRKSQIDKLIIQNKLSKFYQDTSLAKLSSAASLAAKHFFYILKSLSEKALLKSQNQQIDIESLNSIQACAQNAFNLSLYFTDFGTYPFPNFDSVNLNNEIIGLRSSLKNIIGQDIDVHFKLSQNIPQIYADKTLIEQIILGLVERAKKNILCFGEISIETHLQDEKLLLTVSDNGNVNTDHHFYIHDFSTRDQNQKISVWPQNLQDPILFRIWKILQILQASISINTKRGIGNQITITFFPYIENFEITTDNTFSDFKKTILFIEDLKNFEYLVENEERLKNYKIYSISGHNFKGKLPKGINSLDIIIANIDFYTQKRVEFSKKIQEKFPKTKLLFFSSLSFELIPGLEEKDRKNFYLKENLNYNDFINLILNS